jgi:hypothetical protein
MSRSINGQNKLLTVLKRCFLKPMLSSSRCKIMKKAHLSNVALVSDGAATG